MGELIGKASSRKVAMKTLIDSEQYIPSKRIRAYKDALNRVRYEFQRHEPVAPTEDYCCGYCKKAIHVQGAAYCWNCGREIKRL